MASLETFAEARASFLSMADALRAPFFYFSPANVLPKLALGKIEIEAFNGGFALVSPDGSARIIPTGDVRAYYDRIIAGIGRYGSVSLVPAYMAKHMAGAYKHAVQHREYLLPTETVRTHGNPSLSRLRKYINAAQRKSTIETFAAETHLIGDYLALNQLWYRQAAPTKFRTYDKTSIDWLIENWERCTALAPDLVMLGVRDIETGALLSFNVGSKLTENVWTAYTERYDRNAPFRQPNTAGFVALAQRFEQPHENDGTADTKEIREIKDRYAGDQLVAYTMSRKR